MDLFIWLCRTARNHVISHQLNPYSLLSDSSGHCNAIDPLMIIGTSPRPGWVASIRKRWLNVLLHPAKSESIEGWRAEYGLYPNGSRMVPIRHRRLMFSAESLSSADTKQSITDLAYLQGKTIRATPNSYHPEARIVHAVVLVPTETGWRLDVRYGYRDDHFSWWTYQVAKQSKNETFDYFIVRATRAANRKIIGGIDKD